MVWWTFATKRIFRSVKRLNHTLRMADCNTQSCYFFSWLPTWNLLLILGSTALILSRNECVSSLHPCRKCVEKDPCQWWSCCTINLKIILNNILLLQTMIHPPLLLTSYVAVPAEVMGYIPQHPIQRFRLCSIQRDDSALPQEIHNISHCHPCPW